MLPIRYINLDRATQRRAFMEAQGERLGLALERVRAVEAADLDPDDLRRLATSWERDLSGGEVGCFLSHRGEWERVAREDRPAVILEDDAVFSRHLPGAIGALGAIGDADLVNLEDTGRRRFLASGPGREIAPAIRLVRCHRDKSGTGGYVLWPDAARRLLERSKDRAAPSDAFLHGAGLAAFVCEPPLVLQAEFLVGQGLPAGIDGASFVQPPAGGPRKPRARTLRQTLRRAGTQAALLPLHLRRLAGLTYRRVAVDRADFT